MLILEDDSPKINLRRMTDIRGGTMSEQDLVHITAPTKPLHRLKIAPLTEDARAVMLKHSCRLDEQSGECTIFFPEGTTRTEIFLRTMNPRYQIKLPDGYELREVYDRHREVSMLLYSVE